MQHLHDPSTAHAALQDTAAPHAGEDLPPRHINNSSSTRFEPSPPPSSVAQHGPSGALYPTHPNNGSTYGHHHFNPGGDSSSSSNDAANALMAAAAATAAGMLPGNAAAAGGGGYGGHHPVGSDALQQQQQQHQALPVLGSPGLPEAAPAPKTDPVELSLLTK